MKLIGNIVCTIAILTQIILSLGMLSHAPDCASNQPLSFTDTWTNADSQPANHCGCNHDHHTPKANNLEHTLVCEFTPQELPQDCTCSTSNTSPYLFDDQIVDLKSKDHILENTSYPSTHLDLSQFSLLLTKANQSNAPPSEHGSVYLPQHHARFTSIHLGVFLI